MFVEEIVTIDGPTSSGKNSVGTLLAQKLGYIYIDTGIIYRLASLSILQNNISLEDKEKILEVFENLEVDPEKLDREDLHSPEISETASIVAAIPEVRVIMKQLQRRLASSGKVVMGGRDIGSEIFPEVRFKFFLTATPEVRAERRFKQLVQKDPAITFDEVLKSLKERDERDTKREASPLRVPEGGIVIDNTSLTVEQSVEEMLRHIRQNA